jgi:hypothetical protein
VISAQAPEQTDRPSTRVSWGSVAALAALVLLPGLAYVAAVLLPYLASDLDTLSLPDLADGARDAAGLGPEDDVPRWRHLLGFAALLLAPLGALLALGGCVVQLLAGFPRHEDRVSPGVAAGLGLVAVVCLGVLSYFLSPLGRALTTWQLD